MIYHPADPDQFGSAMFNALTTAIVRERIAINGGTNIGCGHHLFQGADAEYVDAAAGFIERHNAATIAGTALNVQGLWFKSPAFSESGWGVNLTQQGDILFATWFTYDTDGRGMWLVLPSGARTGPGAYTGALYRTTGTPLANAWVNSALVATEVGSASLNFIDANRGTFTYTAGGVTQTKPITRQIYREPATVCR